MADIRDVIGQIHAPQFDDALRGHTPSYGSDRETARYMDRRARENRKILEGVTPRVGGVRRTASGRAAKATGQGRTADTGSNLYSAPIPYRYPSESPERAWYPQERAKACQLARDVYRDDELVGTAMDIISDMAFGEFSLKGEGIDGSIKADMESAASDCQLELRLPEMAREFLVTGEAGPQNIWDDARGRWRRTYLHRSEDLAVYDCGLFMDEPVVQFTAPAYIRSLMVKDHPAIRAQRRKIPHKTLEQMLRGEPLTLEPANFTLIARKMSSNQPRGTSLMTRLWRAVVYQDAIFAAAIQTARRMALPLKILKLGDPSANYYPTPEQEEALLQKVAEQELDPGAWLTWSWALTAELVGVQERALPITQHAPLIETMKLSALGINRAILLGESSYSSAAAGLTIFLQRLLALRNLFVRRFLIPKFFGMMAVANGWKRKVKKSDPERRSNRWISSSSDAHLRVAYDHDQALDLRDYILPDIEWRKALDSNVDSERIAALTQLKPLGASLAPQELYSLAGADFEESARLKLKADEFIQKVSGGDPRKMALLMGADPAAGGGGGGGGGFGGMPPILPGNEMPSMDGLAPPGEGAPPEAPADGAAPPPDAAPPTAAGGKPHPNAPEGRAVEGWPDDFVQAGVRLFTTFDPEEVLDISPWDEIIVDGRVADALSDSDGGALWDAVETVLAERGAPPKSISALTDALTAGVRRQAIMQRVARLAAVDAKVNAPKGLAQQRAARKTRVNPEFVRVTTDLRLAALQHEAAEGLQNAHAEGRSAGASYLAGAD